LYDSGFRPSRKATDSGSSPRWRITTGCREGLTPRRLGLASLDAHPPHRPNRTHNLCCSSGSGEL